MFLICSFCSPSHCNGASYFVAMRMPRTIAGGGTENGKNRLKALSHRHLSLPTKVGKWTAKSHERAPPVSRPEKHSSPTVIAGGGGGREEATHKLGRNRLKALCHRHWRLPIRLGRFGNFSPRRQARVFLKWAIVRSQASVPAASCK